MNRIEQLRSGLASDGVAPARADQIVGRLGAIAKRWRQAKVERIDRERKAIKAARSGLTAVLKKFLAGAARDIARQVTAARDAAEKASADQERKKKIEAILEELDFASWETLPSDVVDILIAVTQNGIGVAFNQIGYDPDTDIVDQVNAKAAAWARERSAEMVGMTYDEDGNLIENPDAEWAITDTTRDMLREAVGRAIDEGTSTDDFADELEGEYAFGADRAEMIARTEIAQADVEGNLMAYSDSGMVSGKEWVLGSEHDDDDECDDAADMGVVPLDDDFGGIGDPPAHPNCVCDVLPVLDEEE